MTIDLLEVLSKTLAPATVQVISGHLEESPTAVQRGISPLLATLLAGLGSKATTWSGASNAYAMLKSPEVNPEVLSSLAKHLDPGQSTSLKNAGRGMLAKLFGGDRLSGLGPALAQISGLRSSSATSLAMIVAPIVFGTLRKLIDERGLDLTSTAALLSAQQSSLTNRLEPELTSALGLGSSPDRITRLDSTDVLPSHAITPGRGSRKFDMSTWLAVTVGLPIAIALLWYFVRTIGTRTPVTVPAASLAASGANKVMPVKAPGRGLL